jgi:hypothetical protein
MDSLGTAEAVVTVSERVAPRAAAGTGVPGKRAADGTRRTVVSAFHHRDRLSPVTANSPRRDVPQRDDILADRHDAIYRAERGPGYGRWHD